MASSIDFCISDDPESARRAQRAVQLAHAYHQAAVTDEGTARTSEI
jgi:maltose O-acetyltransferase